VSPVGSATGAVGRSTTVVSGFDLKKRSNMRLLYQRLNAG
jgi:hypothetical protein